jgi:hypothetical protein
MKAEQLAAVITVGLRSEKRRPPTLSAKKVAPTTHLFFYFFSKKIQPKSAKKIKKSQKFPELTELKMVPNGLFVRLLRIFVPSVTQMPSVTQKYPKIV